MVTLITKYGKVISIQYGSCGRHGRGRGGGVLPMLVRKPEPLLCLPIGHTVTKFNLTLTFDIAVTGDYLHHTKLLPISSYSSARSIYAPYLPNW